MRRGLGVAVKLLHKSSGHIVTVELKSGEVYRGIMIKCGDNWNCELGNITYTAKNGEESQLEHVFIQGRQVRFIVIPDMLKDVPVLKKAQARVQHAHEPAHVQYDATVRSFTAEQTKEAFDIARNNVEFLSTVLSSSPQHDALQGDLTTTLVQQCRESQTTVQRIIETAGENEALLSEALNVNDELVKTLSRCEEMNKPSAPLTAPEPAMIPVAEEPDDSPVHGKEESLVRKPSSTRAGIHGGGGSGDDMTEVQEAFVIARNSIELLSTALPSSPQHDALQDDLTTLLVQQCREAQTTVQRIIETAGENEALYSEALNVNDELVKTLSKYEEMNKPSAPLTAPEPDSPVHGKEESLVRKSSSTRAGIHGGGGSGDDLDEMMIFGKKSGGNGDSSTDGGHDPK